MNKFYLQIMAMMIITSVNGMDKYVRESIKKHFLKTWSMQQDNENFNKITTQISDDGNQGKIYTVVYPFSQTNGYVKIKDANYSCSYSEFPQGFVTIILDRHKYNKVIVKAVLQKQLAKKNKGLPWNDDTIKNDSMEHKDKDKIRGGNRIQMQICEYGTYYITIPDDTDLKVKLSAGSHIEYNSSIPTALYVKGVSVNYAGNAHTPFSWVYFNKDNPKTELKLKTAKSWDTNKEPGLIKFLNE